MLAAAITYTPPPKNTRTQSKVVKIACVITSEEVSAEVEEVVRKKEEKAQKCAKSAREV